MLLRAKLRFDKDSSRIESYLEGNIISMVEQSYWREEELRLCFAVIVPKVKPLENAYLT